MTWPYAATVLDHLRFDPDELRDRYRTERDKRIRTDGNDQYVEVVGAYERFVQDVFADASIEREPCHDEAEVVIIGGGFGGVLAGLHLHRAGIDDVRLVETGAEVGGTWYWNRYPGAQCDIESYVYFPLLEEMGYLPTRKYAFGDEIHRYVQALAERAGLSDRALFQTTVTELRWDEDAARWLVHTDRGDRLRARHVIQSTGILNRPKLPAIDGIDSFRGRCFHTSRWDYAYTGGSPAGGLTGLADKRVAIIGTGASAVQAIPHLGASAGHLYVFQRTPSSIDVRGNRPTDAQWAASLEPGWQQARITNFNVLVEGGHQDVDLVSDGWTDIMRRLRLPVRADGSRPASPAQAAAALELADFEKMESIRARVDAIVTDPDTARALKPYYRHFCKRPCFHDEYLPTFNRPNVTLVDTDGSGVDRVTETAVVVGERTYQVDCIIFASGFEVGTDQRRRSGFETIGRGGRSLSDAWADGMRTFHGFHVHGFPNCHLMGLTQTGVSVNFSLGLHEQAKHLAHVISEAQRRHATTLEATTAAVQAWQDEMARVARDRADFFESCTPGYYNNEGHTGEGKGFTATAYGGGSEAFYRILQAWRDRGDLDGLDLR